MNDESPLAGRVALVTGSSRNIGRAIALALARDGAAVMVNARTSSDAGARVVSEIASAGGRAAFHAADVSRPADVDALVAATVAAFGGLDILVNNASVRRERAFDALGFDEWKEILGVTLDGAFLCSRAALPSSRGLGSRRHREHRRPVGAHRIGRARARGRGEGGTGRAHARPRPRPRPAADNGELRLARPDRDDPRGRRPGASSSLGPRADRRAARDA